MNDYLHAIVVEAILPICWTISSIVMAQFALEVPIIGIGIVVMCLRYLIIKNTFNARLTIMSSTIFWGIAMGYYTGSPNETLSGIAAGTLYGLLLSMILIPLHTFKLLIINKLGGRGKRDPGGVGP